MLIFARNGVTPGAGMLRSGLLDKRTAYGLSFPKSGITFADVPSSFLRYRYIGLPEVVGLAIVVRFSLLLLRTRRLVAFLRKTDVRSEASW